MTKLFEYTPSGLAHPPTIPAGNELQDLHDVIVRSPNVLPGDEVDPEIGCKWIVIGSEVDVPDPQDGRNRWAMDILLGDQDATPTLVECKRAGSAQIRREVIGQAMEYAANAQHYWDRDLLEQTAQHRAGSAEAVKDRLQEIGWEHDSRAYFEAFERKLKDGEFRILFAVDYAPPRLRSTVEFLNAQFKSIDVLIVEIRRYSINGSTVITSGVCGYSEAVRARKRDAERRAMPRHHDEASFLALLDGLDKPALTSAAAELLREAKTRGWGIRYSRFGSLLLSPPGFMQRTTLAIIPEKGGLLQWYIGEFTERAPSLAKALEELTEIIGSSRASKLPSTTPEVWAAQVLTLSDRLHAIGQTALSSDSAGP